VTRPAFSDPVHARAVAVSVRQLGRDAVSVDEIPAGLGTRRFLRIAFADGEPSTLIARVDDATPVAPGAPVPEPPLEPIRRLLEQNGLPVPRRYGSDPVAGIELLEDVGDLSLERAVDGAEASTRRLLYSRAIALIPLLQAITPDGSPIAAFGRRLDAALIDSKARKWLDWTIPFALGRPATPAERDTTNDAFAIVTAACERASVRLAHRDYKAANLHLVQSVRDAEPRLVMIDLQGAFMAPPEYDLVCLLRDSHVLLPELEILEHLESVRPRLPDAPGKDEFDRRFDLITLARVAKDLSHYIDAAMRRRDLRYLPLLGTGIDNLAAAAGRAATRDGTIEGFAELVSSLREVLLERAREESDRGPVCAP
jgi:aminoglycoside/choline kinase family phosphotransferase